LSSCAVGPDLLDRVFDDWEEAHKVVNAMAAERGFDFVVRDARKGRKEDKSGWGISAKNLRKALYLRCEAHGQPRIPGKLTGRLGCDYRLNLNYRITTGKIHVTKCVGTHNHGPIRPVNKDRTKNIYKYRDLTEPMTTYIFDRVKQGDCQNMRKDLKEKFGLERLPPKIVRYGLDVAKKKLAKINEPAKSDDDSSSDSGAGF